MSSLQLTNVPDDLLERLKFAADAHRQDVSREAISRLSESFNRHSVAGKRSPEELRQLARQIRGDGNCFGLTPEFIRMAREYGRE
jgi:plasmid stability protein